MAPAQSKPSDMVKKFMVEYKTTDGRIGRIDVSSKEARDILTRCAITFQAKGNNALKDAATHFGSAALIQATLDGEVDQRFAIPVVGRGNGRDTADKSFYKGNGDGELKPEMFVLHDGVYFCSDAMYEASLALVESTYDAKVATLKKKNPAAVPEVVHTNNKKMKLNDGSATVAKAPDSGNVSLDTPNDGDSKLPAFSLDAELKDATKANILDAFFPALRGVNASVETKAKMYDAYVEGSKLKE